MKVHTCGLKRVTLNHQFQLVAFTDVAFKAKPEEPTGLALRGLAAALCEDNCDVEPMSQSSKVIFVDFIVRRQRRAVWSTFSAELNGLVDVIEQMLPLQCALHHIYIYMLWCYPVPGEDGNAVRDRCDVSTVRCMRGLKSSLQFHFLSAGIG